MQSDPEELWVERIENSPAIEATTNREPFDVYIDEVRFIPDAATVIKVRRKTLFFTVVQYALSIFFNFL